MSTIIKEYVSVPEFIKSIDEAISEYRKILGEMLRKLEESRIKSEQEKHLRTLLSKFGMQEISKTNEIDLKSIKVIYNPTPQQELLALEVAVESLNNKITTLSAVRKELEVLTGLDIRLKVIVVYVDDIPKTVMLKFD